MDDNVTRKVINCSSVCKWKGLEKKIIGLDIRRKPNKYYNTFI